jgi:hypothetical protein
MIMIMKPKQQLCGGQVTRSDRMRKGRAGLAKAPNYDKWKVGEAEVNNTFLNSLD